MTKNNFFNEQEQTKKINLLFIENTLALFILFVDKKKVFDFDLINDKKIRSVCLSTDTGLIPTMSTMKLSVFFTH